MIIDYDGLSETIIATDWKGAPSNPCTFDDMARKFRRYAGNTLTPGQIQEVIERVRHLQVETDTSEVARLIRGLP